MLNKAILLNLHIAQGDMRTLLGLSITALVLMFAGMAGMFFLSIFLVPIILICYFIFYIRIANKVFFHSFFDDAGAMYMTLPIPAKDMVLGKVLAVSGYMTLIQLLLLAGVIAEMVIFKGSNYDLLTALTGDMELLTGTPAEVASVFGLFPVSAFTSCLFSSSFLLAFFLNLGMKKKKLLTCWIAYGVVNGVLGSGLDQLAKLFEDVSFGSAINTCISSVVYLSITVVLIRYCVKQLEEKYDV